MVTKIGMGDDVGDPYPCIKFYYDTISGFCTYIQSDSARFFLFGGGEWAGVLATPYSQAHFTDFYNQYIK